MVMRRQMPAARHRATVAVTSGRARLRLIAIAAVGAAAAAGCGSAAAPSGPAPAKVSLTVTLTGARGEPHGHWTVRCDPAGGTHPDPAGVCKALIAARPFVPQPPRKACPQIIVDSRAVIMTGTWFGKKVHRVVIDGLCDLGLFAKLSRIFN